LFKVIDNLCEIAKTNVVIKRMLDNFVAKLITGKYFIRSKGDPPDHTSEQGDFLKILTAHDRSKNRLNGASKTQHRDQEKKDSVTQLCDINGFNLPTLFGEPEDLTNYEFDADDFKYFKYFDLFDENGKVYADTLWSTVDHGATTV